MLVDIQNRTKKLRTFKSTTSNRHFSHQTLIQGLASPSRKAKQPLGMNFTLSNLAWQPCGFTLSNASISFTQS